MLWSSFIVEENVTLKGSVAFPVSLGNAGKQEGVRVRARNWLLFLMHFIVL